MRHDWLAAAGRRIYLALVAAFIAAPLIVVAGVSLNATRRMRFPPDALGLGWYAAFFGDPQWMEALRASLLIAALAALLAVVVALPLAYAAWRYRSRGARVLAGVGSMVFLLPAVVTAVMFSAFWSAVAHVGHLENVAISHAAMFLGIPLSLLAAGFSSIDPVLLEAARTLGAREADAVRMVVRPAMTPYLTCALAYVFVLSLNEYLVAYLVAGFSVPTLPIRIFTNLRTGYEPTMCVAAVLFMAVGFCTFGLIARLGDLPRLMGRQRPLRD